MGKGDIRSFFSAGKKKKNKPAKKPAGDESHASPRRQKAGAAAKDELNNLARRRRSPLKTEKKGKEKAKAPIELVDSDDDDADFVATATKHAVAPKQSKKVVEDVVISDSPEIVANDGDDDGDDDVDEEAALALLLGSDDDGNGDGEDSVIDADDENPPKKNKKEEVGRVTAAKQNASSTPSSPRRSPKKGGAYGKTGHKHDEAYQSVPTDNDESQAEPPVTHHSKGKGSATVKIETMDDGADGGSSDDDDGDGDAGFVPSGAKRARKRAPAKKQAGRAKDKDGEGDGAEKKSKAMRERNGAKKVPPKKEEEEEEPVGTTEGSTPAKKATPSKSHYRAYMQRNTVPPNLGSKTIPKGAQNCLGGLNFVVTGVLDSIERDQAEKLIKDHGGTIKSGVSKKVNFMVVGTDPGSSKMKKATDLGLKTLDEDGLFDLVRTLPEKPFEEYEPPGSASKKKGAKKKQGATPVKKESKVAATQPGKKTTPENPYAAVRKTSATPANPYARKSASAAAPSPRSQSPSGPVPDPDSKAPPVDDTAELWTVKYAPTNVSKIIGQQGARSPANKLKHWLNRWHINYRRKDKKPFKSDDGWEKKAVFFHGPPGVGKTTTATLVCRECGYEPIELNASDTRSKKLLEARVGTLTGNCTMTQFYGLNNKPVAQKIAIIFDEIDGIGGGDRGGIGEILTLVKKTKVPIICIANETPQKLKTLRMYCFEIPFRKMQTDHIRKAMFGIAHKEGLKVNPIILNQIIEGANGDVRQIINNLYMWSRNGRNLTANARGLEKDISSAAKNLSKTPWDCVPVFFRPTRTPNLAEYTSLFFQDYQMMPLFVQENYLKYNPSGTDVQGRLDALADAAEAISDSDLMDKVSRDNMDFSTLPLMAVMSCIRPAFYMRGSGGGRIDFSSWFGCNSRQGKFRRLCVELQQHTRTEISADANDMRLSYVPYLRESLTQPLVSQESEGVPRVIEVMNAYHLTRIDFDSINELSQLKDMPDPMKKLNSKTKSAFTRTYNKASILLPYAEAAPKKMKKGSSSSAAAAGFPNDDDDGDDENNGDDDSVGADGMIKQKGKAKGGATTTTTSSRSGGKRGGSSSSSKSSKSSGRPKAKTAKKKPGKK